MLIELDRQSREFRLADLRRDADQWRVMRQAQAVRKPWPVRTGCWFLGRLGEFMVRAGQRLQQVQPA